MADKVKMSLNDVKNIIEEKRIFIWWICFVLFVVISLFIEFQSNIKEESREKAEVVIKDFLKSINHIKMSEFLSKAKLDSTLTELNWKKFPIGFEKMRLDSTGYRGYLYAILNDMKLQKYIPDNLSADIKEQKLFYFYIDDLTLLKYDVSDNFQHQTLKKYESIKDIEEDVTKTLSIYYKKNK